MSDDPDRVEKLEAALADFRDHGLRCDLNPTHRAGDEAFWHGYLARVDESVRARARSVLADPDEAHRIVTTIDEGRTRRNRCLDCGVISYGPNLPPLPCPGRGEG